MTDEVPDKPVVGWREWVSLPRLGIEAIKPKIDTGARSSALHAFDLESFRDRGVEIVRFCVHPLQRDDAFSKTVEAEVLEYRRVTSSSGHRTKRPVIRTDVQIRDLRWEIELTLANRDEMGFRMLLGREAIRGRFLVDPGRSYLIGKRRRKKKRIKRPARESREAPASE